LSNSFAHGRRFGLLRTLGAAAMLSAAFIGTASAQLLPPGFFNAIPDGTSAEPAGIEADLLAYDSEARVITAEGGVVMTYGGYVLKGDRLVYNQGTGEVSFVGHVVVTGANGTTYTSDDLQLTGGMKQAFLQSLTITTPDGSRIVAADVDYEQQLKTVLTDASFAPCGDCIDAKGRKIGWRVHATKMVYNTDSKTVELVDPKLELLGVPVAWLPYLSFPDPSQYSDTGFKAPSIDYSEEIGLKVAVPYGYSPNVNTTLIFTPTLVSRQGFLMDGEWLQRFDRGVANVKVSGIYQLQPDAFGTAVGNRTWRGSAQTAGQFTPIDQWTVGWSYTAFSDAAYLKDYRFTTADELTNQVFATQVTRETFFDIRLQEYRRLGNVLDVDQNKQARALPVVRYNTIFELGEDRGRINVSGKLLGVQRGTDEYFTRETRPGETITYAPGLAGNKAHLMLEGAYETQWILPGGVAARPYLGIRGDAAYYDGTSEILPGETSLLALTPIAALDLRWPLMAAGFGATHVVEPIAQLVYRGSDTTLTGITNDDAQSFVFDDTNLFSFNRFSGSDRQETGLRANIGGHYQANLDNGGYVDLIAGQSFHLAGVNALGVIDHTQTGNSSGLEDTASYSVLGAKAQVLPGLEVGGKLLLDSGDLSVARAGLGASFSTTDGYVLSGGYVYLPAEAARGTLQDQQEVVAFGQVPVLDYWRVRASGAWDLSASTWLEARAGLGYDDGYLAFSVDAGATGPTHNSPDDKRITASFRLKTASGTGVGLDNVGFGF